MSDTLQLRGGHQTTDPRLDRLPEFDEESRNYPIRELVQAASPRSYTWRVDKTLDQGTEGACVGFAWAHELVARPKVVKDISEKEAQIFYRRAQELDEWEGTGYEGTSVLGGAKAVLESGFIGEYRWAFDMTSLIKAVGHSGPAILGVNWYTGMFNTDEKGFIHATGEVAGGHAILCHGVNYKKKYFKLHNSWGKDWGKNGECYISFEDVEKLLKERGEACIPVLRNFKAIVV